MVKYLILCVCITSGYIVYSTFPIIHGPGITAKEEPEISHLTWEEPFTFKDATLTPKKQIEGEVRILDRKRYYFDSYSRYSPIDVIVGWNDMSDERNLDYIYHMLSDRSFELNLSYPPIERDRINRESDLWHLIPSTSLINEQIKQLRKGHIIKIEGLIVDINHDTGFNFISSTSITDVKNKTGFAIWVQDFQIR